MGNSVSTDFAILIPVLNEREGLEKTLREVIELGYDPARVLVVDGGSTDGTPEVARSLGVRVVRQEGRGKADAIKSGLKYVNGSVVVVMDGDYTYPAEHIQDLIKKINEGYDLVIGARKQIEKRAQSVVYRFGNWFLTSLFNVFYGVKLSDALSGMYAVRKRVLDEVEFEFKDFSVEAEILSHTLSTGYKVAEVPIKYRKRVGEKKLGVRHGFTILLSMLLLTWRYNPTFTVLLLGALTLIPGLYFDFYVFLKYVLTGVIHHIRALVGAIFTTTGIVSFSLALSVFYMKRMEVRLLRRISQYCHD
ncbi:glycosyltransferase family 2 protein [Thermogladius sp. KZ2Tp1]|uniref:glycosyltransferase family 2 protein n=1 Tax=Thermogladius sp. KZ2Tp1 TaxID=3136289 RepID=UPI003DA81140